MAMIVIADGQPTNKVAMHWAHKLANRKARWYAFLDLGATSGVPTEEDKQDLDNTGKMSRKTFMFPDGHTGKATKKMLLKHNEHCARLTLDISERTQASRCRIHNSTKIRWHGNLR